MWIGSLKIQFMLTPNENLYKNIEKKSLQNQT